MNIKERKARLIEEKRQARAKGKIITSPQHPIIGSRAHEQPSDPANRARRADFHARWNGQAEPLIQLWR
ncbi:hypothetical protein FZZ93_05640 [Halomonas eurihalina]|uniref:Uncharacterized protein n=1 Tax=Halomonas eurihalina TaxID=42566 RepID=A0A5D9DAC4_HALER|nr:hypothetical protein [Halomonas eurihalina]MDR5859435.1 hypothetical protein [Halomonas eurihalina]TZG40529.1 hypothetical protein FZZ93_05640 [Halomonas eurihalina]